MKLKLLTAFLLISFVVNAQKENKKKLYYSVEFRYLKGISSSSNTSLLYMDKHYGKNLRLSIGYNFNNNISSGIGIGADRYESPGINTFPIYGELKAFLKNKKKTPYSYFDLGYSVKFSEAQENGLLFDAGLGYKFNKFFIELGYNYKNIPNWFEFNNNSGEKEWSYINMHSISFAAGLIF